VERSPFSGEATAFSFVAEPLTNVDEALACQSRRGHARRRLRTARLQSRFATTESAGRSLRGGLLGLGDRLAVLDGSLAGEARPRVHVDRGRDPPAASARLPLGDRIDERLSSNRR